MRTFVTAIATASLVLPLAFNVSAEQKSEMHRDSDKMRTAWTKPADVVESKKLIGARVKGADGKDVGEIDQLLVNQDDGKISHVVLGKGGFAGIGETKLVLPWSDMKVRWEDDKVVVSVDTAALDRAHRYEARDHDRDRAPAASPTTTPRRDKDTRR